MWRKMLKEFVKLKIIHKFMCKTQFSKKVFHKIKKIKIFIHHFKNSCVKLTKKAREAIKQRENVNIILFYQLLSCIILR